ncbi:MAG TPA: hypothetical protein VFM03_01720 [Candidatus Limnocylindria bacterium]|jgi:hypothetical protein|nr:hypothetical protein [Candidatus Limnocylindria bacterium]
MSDSAIGLIILGTAMAVVVVAVFVIASRTARPVPETAPPPGVHMPSPSLLPVLVCVGAILIGAGLAFGGEGEIANPWIAIPGLVVLIGAIVGWVRAANREWTGVEHGFHDDGTAH